MNIKILIILVIASIIMVCYENSQIKKDLYDKDLLSNLNVIDKNLDLLSIKYNCFKIYEFSIKMSENKVSNKRFAYGITLDGDLHKEIDKKILDDLNVPDTFKDLINKNLGDQKIVSIGLSEDINNNADRVYVEIDENEGNYLDPSIISYEKIGEDIYTRTYISKNNITEYLSKKLLKCGKFGSIVNYYFPSHKLNDMGYQYKSDRIEGIKAFRIFLNEYNSVNDLKYFLFDLADYFKMSNENILKIKRWIYHFRHNEVNML